MHHDYDELERLIDELEYENGKLKADLAEVYREKAEAAESYIKMLEGRDRTASNQADYIAKLQSEKKVQEDTIRGYQARQRIINKAFLDMGYVPEWENTNELVMGKE